MGNLEFSTVRTVSPTTLLHYVHTPLPQDPASSYQEVRLDIPTSCSTVGMLYQLASHHREFRSGCPVPPRDAIHPSLQDTIRQQKIKFIRAATAPENSGRRIKLNYPLFINRDDPKATSLVHDLLSNRLATKLTTVYNGSSPTVAS
jgi:hypothetical protein